VDIHIKINFINLWIFRLKDNIKLTAEDLPQFEKMQESIKLCKKKTSKILNKSQSIIQTFQTVEKSENKHNEMMKIDVGKRHDDFGNTLKSPPLFNEDNAARTSDLQYTEKENLGGKKQSPYGAG